MFLIYEGPHLEVEVLHDEVPGGLFVATRGKAVDVPDEVAADLLAQGEENEDQIPTDPETGKPVREPQHDRTWRKATPKESTAAQKAAEQGSPSEPPTETVAAAGTAGNSGEGDS